MGLSQLNEEEIWKAFLKDKESKKTREERINSSKYKRHSNIKKGDRVLVRNYKRTSKFQPIFIPDPYTVTSVDGVKITVEREGKSLKRHPDDMKILPRNLQEKNVKPNPKVNRGQEVIEKWQEAFKLMNDDESDQENDFVIEIRADADPDVTTNSAPTHQENDFVIETCADADPGFATNSAPIPEADTYSKPQIENVKRNNLKLKQVKRLKKLALAPRVLRSHKAGLTTNPNDNDGTATAEKATAKYLLAKAALRSTNERDRLANQFCIQ